MILSRGVAHLIKDNHLIGIKIMFDKSYHDAIIEMNKIQKITDAVMRDNVIIAAVLGFFAYTAMIALLALQTIHSLPSSTTISQIIIAVVFFVALGFITAALNKRHHFKGNEHLFD